MASETILRVKDADDDTSIPHKQCCKSLIAAVKQTTILRLCMHDSELYGVCGHLKSFFFFAMCRRLTDKHMLIRLR